MSELNEQIKKYESLYNSLKNDHQFMEDILTDYNALVEINFRSDEEEKRIRELFDCINKWNNSRVTPVYDEYLRLSKMGISRIENPDKYRFTPQR